MKKFSLAFILLTVLFSLSCKNAFLDTVETSNVETGVLSFEFSNSARTILPEFDVNALTEISLSAKDNKDNTISIGTWENYQALEASFIEISTGSYAFILSAKYNSKAVTALTNVAIKTGSNTITFLISLTEGSDDLGTVKVLMEFDPTQMYQLFNANLYSIDENNIKHLVKREMFYMGRLYNPYIRIDSCLFLCDAEGNIIEDDTVPTNIMFNVDVREGLYYFDCCYVKMNEDESTYKSEYHSYVHVVSGETSFEEIDFINEFQNAYVMELHLNEGFIVDDTTDDIKYGLFHNYSLDGDTYTPVTFYSSEEGILLPDASTTKRPGYVFEGWYEDEDLLIPAKEFYMPGETSGDKKFYAKWIESSDESEDSIVKAYSTNNGKIEYSFTPTQDADLAIIYLTNEGLFGLVDLIEGDFKKGEKTILNISESRLQKGKTYGVKVILGKKGDKDNYTDLLYLRGCFYSKTEEGYCLFTSEHNDFSRNKAVITETEEGFNFTFPVNKETGTIKIYFKNESDFTIDSTTINVDVNEFTEETFVLLTPYEKDESYKIEYYVKKKNSDTDQYNGSITGTAKYTTTTKIYSYSTEDGIVIHFPSAEFKDKSFIYYSVSDARYYNGNKNYHKFYDITEEDKEKEYIEFLCPYVWGGETYKVSAEGYTQRYKKILSVENTPVANILKDLTVTLTVDITEDDTVINLNLKGISEDFDPKNCGFAFHIGSTSYGFPSKIAVYDTENKMFRISKKAIIDNRDFYEYASDVKNLDWSLFASEDKDYDSYYMELEYKIDKGCYEIYSK